MRRMIYSEAKKLLIATAKNNMNAMIVGTHGIGKTYLVQEIAAELGLNMKYWSASTMDPYIDLVGVPYPDKQTGHLQFAQREDIDDMEFLFFDELNRAPLKVRNSVLELVQFKRINGRHLPKLKMVWAAINPPTEDYQVEELDPALRDRFHIHLELAPSVSLEYLKGCVNNVVNAKIAHSWWEKVSTMTKEHGVTPRRLEYLAMALDKGFDMLDVFIEPIPDSELALLKKMIADETPKNLAFTDAKTIKNNFSSVFENAWKNG